MDIDVRRVLDSLGSPLLALDRSARILHANAGLKELLGWSRQELFGRPLSTVIPGGLPGLPWEGPAAPPPGRNPAPYRPRPHPLLRVSALRRDGRPREVEVRLSPWPGGEAEGLVIASFHPLDRQVELERLLRRCHQLQVLDAALAQAFSQSLDEEEAAYAVLRACGEVEGWTLGTYWRMQQGNGVLLPLTLWTASPGLEGFVQATLRSAFNPPEGLPGQAWATRQPIWSRDVTQDVRFSRANEAARHGLHGGLLLPVVGSGGRVYGVLELLSRELREDREADEAAANTLGYHFGRFLDRLRLMDLESTRGGALRHLWDSDLLGLFISDAHGQLLEANPTLLRMLGYSRREVREGNVTWLALTPPEHRLAIEGLLRRLRTQGTFHSFES
ncbi:MAG: PAS domain S-box protein, partial [Archangium sp.]